MVLKNILEKEVTLELVENESDADFITHNGTFHADEVMATCILLNKFDKIKLYRETNVTKKDAFVYDVGFGKFDHHQIDFDERRKNGIKYASCGLVWREFGSEIIGKIINDYVEETVNEIDRNIIMDIDRDDNGESLGVELPIKIQSLPNIIASFNPVWDSKKDENECFLEAIRYTNEVFNNTINKLLANKRAKKIVEEKIDESDGKVLILDTYMPWKDIVLSSKNPKAENILYAIFPSKRGGYNVVATPVEIGSFDVKKPFPNSWAGKEKEELQKISGVKTIKFCHKNLFICSCETFEDAKEIARIALESGD